MALQSTKPKHFVHKRNQKMRAISSTLKNITNKAYEKRGFSNASIINDWKIIVGQELSRVSQPERITYSGMGSINGTLHLRVGNSAFATEIQHLQPLIIERVNTFFGYAAITNLRLIHAPLPTTQKTNGTSDHSLSKTQQKMLTANLSNISDPELRDALKRLGEAVMKR
jgi:hypothetical protein